MSFRSPLVIYYSIPNRAKEKLEGERSQLFTRFTIRVVTQLKINHHCPYHTDQEKHLTACSRFILEYSLCPAKENQECPPGFLLRCSKCKSTAEAAAQGEDLLPAWHCPMAPQGSRAETHTAGTTHLPCSAWLCQRCCSALRVDFKYPFCLLTNLWDLRILTCCVRSKPSCRLIHSLQMDTSMYESSTECARSAW